MPRIACDGMTDSSFTQEHISNNTVVVSQKLTKAVLWLITYFLIALSFVFLANDNTFQELLQIPSFYTDIIFSITVTFAVGFYLRKLNGKLNQEYPWFEMFKARILKQAVLGVVLPLCLAMLAEVIYLYSIDIPLAKSSIINLELPLAFIFLLLVNFVSLASYLFSHKQTVIIKEQVIVNPPKSLEYINVQKGLLEERIELKNCALIVSSSKLVWLHTFSGEKYRLQGTLEEWEEKLRYSGFYRINRQYLSAHCAIQSVEPTETRKLKVNFVVPTEEVYISKANVADFKQWWKQ